MSMPSSKSLLNWCFWDRFFFVVCVVFLWCLSCTAVMSACRPINRGGNLKECHMKYVSSSEKQEFPYSETKSHKQTSCREKQGYFDTYHKKIVFFGHPHHASPVSPLFHLNILIAGLAGAPFRLPFLTRCSCRSLSPSDCWESCFT